MKKNLKILFVYPPNQLLPIETPRPDGSLGPLYLASALEDAGFQTDVLDASVGASDDNLNDTFYHRVKQPNELIRIGMSQDRIRDFIDKGNYGIVGINSNFTPQTRMALEVAAAAKSADPDILVIAGGVNARNLPERFLDSGNVDAVCLTEGEKIVVRIVKDWAQGKDFYDLPGIMHKKRGWYTTNLHSSDDVCVDLDQLPFPAWSKLPFNHYGNIVSQRGVLSFAKSRYAPIMTSRGCPFCCAFCHISTEWNSIGALRLKSVKRVLKEIEVLHTLGVKKLYFEDDSLFAKKSRVKMIFEHVAGMGFEIADVNGVNLVHFYRRGRSGKLEIDIEYLKMLKASGFNQVVFPVESGSQRIIDTYATAKLDLTAFDVVNLIRIASNLGILCPVNIMIGFPDETEDEIMRSIELGKKLVDAGAAYCTFFIPIPFPGSKLFEIAIEKGYLDRNFEPDEMNWKNAVMKNTFVPPERIMELRDWAWRTVNRTEHVEMRLKQSVDFG